MIATSYLGHLNFVGFGSTRAFVQAVLEKVQCSAAYKMSKFADDSKLCHRAKNPDDII